VVANSGSIAIEFLSKQKLMSFRLTAVNRKIRAVLAAMAK
jgi:hypothetical protein